MILRDPAPHYYFSRLRGAVEKMAASWMGQRSPRSHQMYKVGERGLFALASYMPIRCKLVPLVIYPARSRYKSCRIDQRGELLQCDGA